MVTLSKGSRPQFGETVYVSKVNEARKVKSNIQVAVNNNSDPVQKFFRGGWGGQCPQLIFFQTSVIVQIVQLESLYGGCRIIHTQLTVAYMTLPGRWYIGGPAKIHNPHISVLSK